MCRRADAIRTFEYTQTFRHMTMRRLQRRKSGTIANREISTVVALVSSFVIFFALTNLIMDEAPIPSPYDRQTTTLALIMGICVFLTHLCTHSQLIMPILIMGHLTFMLVEIVCISSTRSRCSAYVYASTAAMIFLVSMILVGHIFRALVFGCIMQRSFAIFANIEFWWSVERIDAHSFFYRPSLLSIIAPVPLWFFPSLHPKRFFGYRGELDDQGRPHGYGIWHDTAPDGEVLTGRWEAGFPVGPFRTVNYKTGYTCVSVKVAFAHNRAEELTDFPFLSRFRDGALKWGSCTVECSTAGKFYAHLPNVHNVCHCSADADDENAAAQCLHRVKARSDDDESIGSITVSVDDRGGVKVDGTRTSQVSIAISDDGSGLQVCDAAGERMTLVREHEIVVFIHGFNSPMSDALKRVGQLWTLGDFPNHLVPFVFGWPASRSVCYFRAKDALSERRLIDDFVTFLRNIATSHQRIHIIAHSMGAKLLFNALPRLAQDVFASIHDKEARGVSLETVILLNPDSGLREFIEYEFDALVEMCDHITLYADHTDGALAYSEFFNRHACLGKRPFSIVKSDGRGSSDQMTVLSECSNQTRGAKPVDLDVIDVSWMEHNMHNMRHNFFDLNRLMIDDLREIVSQKKRAASRSRLTHRGSNVWSFNTPPKHVTHP